MVWRLGFAQTRWGAYSAPQNPLAGFRRGLLLTGRGRERTAGRGRGMWDRGGEGREGKVKGNWSRRRG